MLVVGAYSGKAEPGRRCSEHQRRSVCRAYDAAMPGQTDAPVAGPETRGTPYQIPTPYLGI